MSAKVEVSWTPTGRDGGRGAGGGCLKSSMSEPRDGGVELWGFERCGLSEDGCTVGDEHSAGELHRRS